MAKPDKRQRLHWQDYALEVVSQVECGIRILNCTESLVSPFADLLSQLEIATTEKTKLLDLLSAEKEEKRALMPPPEEKNPESKG